MLSAPLLHAAIDLGSNSFHMLVVREVSGTLQTVARIKRKVRLAAGLSSQDELSDEAMQRGWDCLRLFAEQLTAVPTQQIRVVATATLRLATNADQFIGQAQYILGVPITVISGEDEARLIYQGVAQTTGGSDKRLVVDIGGASTELVAGRGTEANTLFSLSMGCVTWLERYFQDRHLTRHNFALAEQAARDVIRPVKASLQQQDWEICVGASGTVQALQEIMIAQGMDEQITAAKLEQLKARAILCGKLEELEIEGLTLERALVFPSGLAILLAIFHELSIEKMSLAGGALREGLAYSMLDLPSDQDICRRTLLSVQQRYFIDISQAQRVSTMLAQLVMQLRSPWNLDQQSEFLLYSAAALHEIGLSVAFRCAPQHAAYLVQHLELPGFTLAQKKLLAALLINQQGNLDLTLFTQQSALPPRQAERLCRLLRLAILLCSTRQVESLHEFTLTVQQENLTLTLPCNWLLMHPLRAELLLQEAAYQSYAHWSLTIG